VIAPTRWAAAALGVAIACGVALTVVATGANAATTTLCALQTAPAMGGAYTVQNNEWGSSASECINTDGNADFAVANSAIANSTSGAPGGYASIYKGCHWGACTTGSNLPIQISNLGSATSSWSTVQPASGAYDVAYELPRTMSEALLLLSNTPELARVVGERFATIYRLVKELEYDEFMKVISSWEREHLLLHV